MIRPGENERPDDETLMAYADGMLDEAERARVARYIEGDAEAREIVSLFAKTAQAASQAYADPLDEAPPRRLIDAIMSQPGASGDADALTRFRPRPSLRRYALPLAASLVLALGGYLAWHMTRVHGPAGARFELAAGPVKSESPVGRLLETRPSGDPVLIVEPGGAPEAEIIVMASFRDKQERICREIESTDLEKAGSPITTAIACRSSDGAWVIEGTARTSATPQPPPDDYRPTAGTRGSEIDDLLGKLGIKPALSKIDEEALLKNGWR